MKKILCYRFVSAHRAIFSAALLAVALIVAPAAYAQSQATTATLEGVVMDESGAVVSGAEVEVRRPATGFVRTISTDSSGRYVFAAIPVGTYDITVTMSGFQPIKYEGVIVTIGARVPLNVTLSVSPVTEAVTVTGEAPLLETSRPTYQQTLNTRSITSLPIVARNFESFVKLTPGVVGSLRNTQSFGGQKGINSNYTIDGADRNNPFFGGQTGGDRPPFVVSIEAIREFVVLNNGFNPEFGRSGAGLVNVVTVSGTNDWHGKAWYYLVDHRFVTNTSSTPAGDAPIEAAGRRQQYGGDFGGRIVRDKLFFYGNTDNQKRDLPIALRLVATPPACSTVTLAAGITLADCDAARQALLAIEEDFSGTDDLLTFLGRVDWNLTSNHRLSGRYNYHKSEQAFGTHGNFNPFGVTTYRGSRSFFGGEDDTNHNTVISLHSAFGARMGNEFRFNYNWEDRPRIQNPIPGAGTANDVSDGSAVVVTGMTSTRPALGAVDFLPIPEVDTRTQFSDNFTYIYGRHELKFGGDYNRSTVDQIFRGSARGVYTFNNFANFVNRRPDAFRQFFGEGALVTNVDEFAFYAQDSWKARHNLTIDYGLRWEGQYNPSNETPNTTFPDGTTEIPDDNRMWAPRLGIAYSPNSKTVVRLWSGLFYSRTPMLLMQPPLNANGDATGGFTVSRSNNADIVTLFAGAGVPVFPFPYAGPYSTPFDTSPVPLPVSGHVTGADLRRMADGFKNSRTFRWGPALEYELFANTTLTFSYTYAFTTHLQRLRDVNLLPSCSGNISGAYNNLCAMGIQVYSSSLRAVSAVRSNVLTESSGKARYHAFTLALNKRYSNNFQLQAFYTWSKTRSHDDNERDASTRRIYDPFRPDLDFGVSNLDVPHNFVSNAVWDLPLGFQVSSIVTWRSGTPIDALTATDTLSTSATVTTLALQAIRLATRSPSATVIRTGNGDGNSSSDRPIVNGIPLRRNAFRQDQFFQTDMRVNKIWRFGERHSLNTFIDLINVFDTDNFIVVDPFPESANTSNVNFLVRNQALSPFLFQLGVRYSF